MTNDSGSNPALRARNLPRVRRARRFGIIGAGVVSVAAFAWPLIAGLTGLPKWVMGLALPAAVVAVVVGSFSWGYSEMLQRRAIAAWADSGEHVDEPEGNSEPEIER